MNKNSILIHIPHSSLNIPENERSKILLSDLELEKELIKMTDRYIDEIFDVPGFDKHINSVSRLVMDPERFRSDKDERMSEVGMGAIYTKTSSGNPLRNISFEEKEKMLIMYYDPYHKNLNEKVQEKINLYGNCFIIDVHSFPSSALLYETDKTLNRPDICIGYEEFHMSSGLVNSAKNFFSIIEGLNVSENEPFAGSIVPNDFYMKDKRVASIMIELNRSLYMDELTGEKLPQFESIKKIIGRFLALIS